MSEVGPRPGLCEELPSGHQERRPTEAGGGEKALFPSSLWHETEPGLRLELSVRRERLPGPRELSGSNAADSCFLLRGF